GRGIRRREEAAGIVVAGHADHRLAAIAPVAAAGGQQSLAQNALRLSKTDALFAEAHAVAQNRRGDRWRRHDDDPNRTDGKRGDVAVVALQRVDHGKPVAPHVAQQTKPGKADRVRRSRRQAGLKCDAQRGSQPSTPSASRSKKCQTGQKASPGPNSARCTRETDPSGARVKTETPGIGSPSRSSKPMSWKKRVPFADTMRKFQPRARANAACTCGGSGDETTNAARLSIWRVMPAKPSPHSVQKEHARPILCTKIRSLRSPNSSARCTVVPSELAKT